MPPPRILLLTAAFGEGHNSAAKNLSLGLQRLGADTLVADPCMLASPFITKLLCSGYRFVTNYMPRLWYKIYLSTDNMDFSRKNSLLMRKPEEKVAELIAEFRPDSIVSTYPIYPYFLDRILADQTVKIPVYTVITDSIEINASWKKAPTAAWLVTDPQTRELLIRAGLPQEKVIDTGFPVHPDFAEMSGLNVGGGIKPFRVLYFPTAKKQHIKFFSRALLDASAEVQLTIVLGKNIRLLYQHARKLRAQFPGRVKVIGWTRRVPQLLNSHHLVVGKAGGATVHEAIAAQCPMLVHHLVPGQEEGNLKLLECLGCGALADTPETMRALIVDLLADQGQRWHAMKSKLSVYHRNAGAFHAARYLLGQIGK